MESSISISQEEDNTQSSSVKETKRLRKYIEKFERGIDSFPNTCISQCQLNRMIENLKNLSETNHNIDIKQILREVASASILSIKEIEYRYVLTHGAEVTLKNGNRFVIRPLISSDKERLIKAVESLSVDTLFMRFMTPIRRLSEAQLNYLINVDLVDHFAIGFLKNEKDYPGIAVARYIRDYADPTLAEWAITVIDEYQGMGIGAMLLYCLSKIAVQNGIHHFTCVIHPTNIKMIKWLYRLGAIKEGTGDDAKYSFDIPLSESLFHNSDLKQRLDEAIEGRGNLPMDCVKDCLPEGMDVIRDTSPLM
ncbi:hypothetical protein WA158_005609 [Blastocystis sp. Blastoise]